jgi:hypothetical protein
MISVMKREWMWLAVALVGCGGAHERDAGADDARLDVGAARDVGPLEVSVPDDVPDTTALPDTFDPFCHYDCFRGSWCADGVVWEQIHAPVPCREWTGMCPRRMLGTCEQGCSARIPSTPGWRPTPEWTLYCVEGEAKRVGDPCETDADCQPPEGNDLDRNYLACDLTTRACAAIDAPVAPTTACTADLSGLFDPLRGSAYGVVEDASCATGLCRFSARPAASECDRHVCALPCSTDWDCPPMSRCESFPDWTGRMLSEGPVGAQSVCRSMADADLVCR